MKILKNFIGDIKKDKFKLFALSILSLLFIFNAVRLYAPTGVNKKTVGDVVQNEVQKEKVLELFYSPSCPHCGHAKEFLSNEFAIRYPDVKIKKYDITKAGSDGLEARKRFKECKEKLGIDRNAVPVAVFGDRDFSIGFGGVKSQMDYVAKTDKFIVSCDANEEGEIQNAGVLTVDKSVDMDEVNDINNIIDGETEAERILSEKTIETRFGEVNFSKYSLTTLSIVFGFIDGFNPCAMWVLIFMISIILELKDKKKIWLIVGTFLVTEAVLYYIFMAFWMNTLTMLEHVTILNTFIGCVALYIAATSLRDVWVNDIACHVDNLQERANIRNKIHDVVSRPLTIMTLFSMIALAAAVNMVEFACSSALPVVYTKMLVDSGISTMGRYAYMALYNLFYMIDDFIIFGFAIFAVNKFIGEKYIKYTKLIAGILLAIIGISMIFFPEFLASLSS